MITGLAVATKLPAKEGDIAAIIVSVASTVEGDREPSDITVSGPCRWF